MPGTTMKELRSKTRHAAERQALIEATVRRRAGQPLTAGEIVVFPEVGRLPVEWAVLEASKDGAILLVPVDSDPQIGSADLVGEPPDGGAPLVLRCGVAVAVHRSALETAQRCGVLDPATLEAARRRVEAVRAERVPPSGEAAEVDLDPEYQDWLSDLRSEGEALRRMKPPARSRRRFSRFEVALAAAVALAVGLVASNAYWLAIHRDRERPAMVPAAEPITNLPMAWLLPDETLRGSAGSLIVPPEAKLVLLLLELERAFPDAVYDLEVVDLGTGSSPWELSGLRRTGTLEVSVAVPRERLPPGRYELRLRRRGGPAEEPPTLYPLTVEAADSVEDSDDAQRQSP